MQQLSVVDLGTGNLHSVAKALEKVSDRTRVSVTADAASIRQSDRVVLPGQGAIGSWFAALDERGLRETILEVLKTRPVLGICVGMQALFDLSDEDGGVAGFVLVPGHVKRFAPETTGPRPLKVPHMGWNNVLQRTRHPLWDEIASDARFYFVHSYYALPNRPQDFAAATEYGIRFASAIACDNIFAVQFHPEKSHHQGLKLLENFMSWDGGS